MKLPPDANLPLVSIVVIAYNSTDYILETLESVRLQTYAHLELIISDDGSKDDTVAVCREWVTRYGSRFKRTQIVTADTNRGIPANCNRGVAATEGEWIKLIAGDDILLPDCIFANINFVADKPDAKIILSNMIFFRDRTVPKEIIGVMKPPRPELWNESMSSGQQYKALLLDFCGNTPSFFIAKEVFSHIQFDERYKFMEDYPFVLNATKRGYKLLYMNTDTVMYRKRDGSAFFGERGRLFGDFMQKRIPFDMEYRYPHLPRAIFKHEVWNRKRDIIFNHLGLNKDILPYRFIYKWSHYANPYYYIIKLFRYDKDRYSGIARS